MIDHLYFKSPKTFFTCSIPTFWEITCKISSLLWRNYSSRSSLYKTTLWHFSSECQIYLGSGLWNLTIYLRKNPSRFFKWNTWLIWNMAREIFPFLMELLIFKCKITWMPLRHLPRAQNFMGRHFQEQKFDFFFLIQNYSAKLISKLN